LLSRWFGGGRRTPPGGNGGDDQGQLVKDADFIVLPAVASDSWRKWLMTGLRKAPFDRRRIRGDHKGIKKMMIEGTTDLEDPPQPWNDFSGAMVRQAVDDALNTLPPEHKQAVKLAYFGGMTNEAIAKHLGVGTGVVRRRLREAIAVVSAHVETGAALGRKAIYAVAAWTAVRWTIDFLRRVPFPATDQVAQAAVVLACGVVTVSVLNSSSPSPAQLTQVDRGQLTAPATGVPVNVSTSPVVGPVIGSVPVPSPAVPTLPTPPVSLPVTLPVTLPSPPPLPAPSILPTPPNVP
jgi:sigma-70-like protein